MGKERAPTRIQPQPKIGTWPTPERWKQMLELIVDLENAVKPVKDIEEISEIIIDFRKKICSQLESSIRSDIGCL